MPFLGMKGTGQFAANERPQNWREMILYLYPNGSAPLTAMLSMLGSESTDDYIYNWWTKGLAEQQITGATLWTDAAMATTAVGAGPFLAGETIYVQGPQAQVQEFREGHQVLLRTPADQSDDVTGKVIGRTLAGATSSIAVRLLEDTPGGAATDLDNVDMALIIGNINPQGGVMPDAISYPPVQLNNRTQIFRTPLSITRTARRTRLRTGDAYQEMKREALELHAIEMEKAFIWGVQSEVLGANGHPETTTAGVRSFIPGANRMDYVAAVAPGTTWLQGGEDWLDAALEISFRFGGTEKLAICGSGALLGLNALAKVTGQIQLTPETTSYGLKVVNWITPFGNIYLKTHPLYSYQPSNRNSMLLLEPDKLKFRYIDDTNFISDPEDRVNRNRSLDGTEEEFLTEAGLELHHPQAFAELQNVGVDA